MARPPMQASATRGANMSSGLLLDSMPPVDSDPNTKGPRFRPFPTPHHHITKGRYITSNDPRGYIPVFEYPLNGQWIMLDMDDGYILWTGIWKALGNSKADIVKMVESEPDLAPQLRRVRGGYLKIQGTWMPYEIALNLARRVAWPIRYELVPLFGPSFPSTCLSPDQPGYGQVVRPGSGKRRPRRSTNQAAGSPPTGGDPRDWTVISPPPATGTSEASHGISDAPFTYKPRQQTSTSRPPQQHSGSSVELHLPYASSAYSPSTSSTSSPLDTSPRMIGIHGSARYSPYPSPRHPVSASHYTADRSTPYEDLRLPPIKAINEPPTVPSGSFSLPPISALDNMRAGRCDDSITVLRRLQIEDDLPSTASSSSSYPPPSSQSSASAWRSPSLYSPCVESLSHRPPPLSLSTQHRNSINSPTSPNDSSPSPSRSSSGDRSVSYRLSPPYSVQERDSVTAGRLEGRCPASYEGQIRSHNLLPTDERFYETRPTHDLTGRAWHSR